ncbi:uncharacterized protein LOC133312734 [Gastrolobium bilobum]|uniref:uncharacterized protein LOC133312734 n=1 Tax=Gastrolobium bilobum TaxID=150636 RepID=UPI002AAFCF6E|nr:uncharacterized protein LOC133312734 [Gastrolobium bilobum]
MPLRSPKAVYFRLWAIDYNISSYNTELLRRQFDIANREAMDESAEWIFIFTNMSYAEPGSTPSQEVSSQNSSKPNYRGKTDPSWGHCRQVIEDGKAVIICQHCNKVIRGGGINRLKNHLAGEKGQVEPCKKVPAEVRDEMKKSVDESKKKKRKVQLEEEESGDYCDDIRHVDNQPPSKSEKGKNNMGSYFIPRTTPGAQPTIKSALQSFKAPTMHILRGALLDSWVDEVHNLVESYRNVWQHTGCTIMADGWTDRCRRTLINFLVYCPKGTIFLKSVDASHASKTADLLFQLFEEVVLFVGPENVVQFVTDNAANYVAAGRLLEAEFPKIFWSPCAAHCINLMLQDIGKLEEVGEAVAHASKITKYVYNHCHPLHLMRKFIGGKEILRPAPTRFATNFIALQSILAQKDALRAMVTSREWTLSAYYKDIKAKRFVEQVLDSRFWKECVDIVKVTEPLVRLLRLVDSEEKPSMGYLYQAFYKAREEMIKRFQRKKRMVEPYLRILDSRWDSQLRKYLHAAGYWLNPGCHFNSEEFQKHELTTSGLLDVIERHAYQDVDLLSNLTAEMRIFRESEFDFGRQAAIRERNKAMPDKWWETYGLGAPNLRKLAIRVLSQTCSASGYQLNLDEDDDDDAQGMAIANHNESNVGQCLDEIGGEDLREPEFIDTTLPPWA